MRVIGAGRHTKALAGWGLIMMGSGSTKATGRENAAGWTTITAGTATTTAISATTTAIATMVMTAIETEVASTNGTVTTTTNAKAEGTIRGPLLAPLL
jgi:hypothetical protein